MTETLCGFNSSPTSSGSELLMSLGPTIFVNIGFDSNYRISNPPVLPIAAIKNIEALVDTGASQCCIDNLLAVQLGLPLIDKQPISGSNGKHLANIYLAQIHIPTLGFTITGSFAGVDLEAGGQRHKALMGRTFLKNFTMIYEGKTGTVKISNVIS
jgi:predicted aspartyl protease